MISAIVIVKNDEQLLPGCLESLRFADEIIVVDNGSTDQSLKIAQRFTKKVYQFKEADFAAMRNFALTKASGDWVLFVDADERVLKLLREEVLKLVSEPSKFVGYAISRRNIILGREERYSAFWPDWVMRLFLKNHFKGYVGAVHEYPQIEGPTGYTKNSLLHLTHRNIDQIVSKSLNYSQIDAKLRLAVNHPKMSSWRFLRILLTELYAQGIKRQGFFNGTRGTIDALMQTFSMIITYARLWEMQQQPDLDATYKEIDKTLRERDFQY